MLSNQQIQNNWPQIKSQVLSKWNKLSEAEVEKTHGNINTLGNLVHTKYGNNEEFDRAFDQICKTSIPSSRNPNTSTSGEKKYSSKQADGVPDFENRSRTAPSAEAGMPEYDTESSSTDDTFHAGSPERRANANYAKVENEEQFLDRETDDELSYYTAASRTSQLDGDESAEFNKLDNNESNTHFSAPDEFYPSQDPSPSREDITLGRKTSSATKLSTAKAASISSEASNDAKKRI